MSTFTCLDNLIITIFLSLFSINNCSYGISENSLVNVMPSWPWKQQEYPEPKTDWKLCNNVSDRFNICDPDRLLTSEQIINLNQLLLNIENMTKCHTNYFDEQNCCQTSNKTGLIIGIALAKQIFYERSSDESKFADGIRNKWQLSKDCNNEIIFFIASQKHKVSVSVGSRSRNILGYSFDQISEQVENIFDKITDNDYYEFLVNATKQYAHGYHNRLQLLSLAHDLSPKNVENYENDNQNLGSNIWLPWNAKQPFATILGITYCFIIIALLMIACYYCCGKKFKNNKTNISSSVSSEQTKYSELKYNITETPENVENKL